MTLQEAINILKGFNEWRKGEPNHKTYPLYVSEALETVISAYEITDEEIIKTAARKYEITMGMSQTNCNKAIKSRHYFIQGAKAFRDGKISKP